MVANDHRIIRGGLVIKNLPTNVEDVRDTGSILGLVRSPGGENDNSLLYSCLENPMDKGAWQATVHEVTESQTQLSDWAHTQKHRIVVIIITTTNQLTSVLLVTAWIQSCSHEPTHKAPYTSHHTFHPSVYYSAPASLSPHQQYLHFLQELYLQAAKSVRAFLSFTFVSMRISDACILASPGCGVFLNSSITPSQTVSCFVSFW